MKLSETGRKSCDKLFSEGCEINSSDGNGAWRAEREQPPESRFGYDQSPAGLLKKKRRSPRKQPVRELKSGAAARCEYSPVCSRLH